MADIKQRILEKLKRIQDPDLNMDIVKAGFVKKLDLKEGKLDVLLELTTPACPIKDQFKKQVEEAALEISEVKSVSVEMSAKSRSTAKENQQNGLKKVNTLFAVASCKGGVGKSTVSALVACELAFRGYKVGILDLDIFGPSLPTLFSLQDGKVAMKDKMLQPVEKEVKVLGKEKSSFKLKLMSFGFLMGSTPAVMRGPIVSNYMSQILNQVDWGELDYLVVDLPPGTGDTQLTLAQSVQLDGSLIVTTQASLSITDVARGVKMFEKVKVPLYGLVDNMAYFICDNCDKKHFIFQDRERDIKTSLGLEVLGQLPLVKEGKNILDFSQYVSSGEVKELVDNLARKIGIFKKSVPSAVVIEKDEKNISFSFSEKETLSFKNRDLRFLCPCAICCNEFTGERKITLEQVKEDIYALEASPLGNYAITIKWSDNHSSGIYSYSYLKQLAGQKEKAGT